VPLDWLFRREAAVDRTAIVRMVADHVSRDAWPGEIPLTRADLVDAMKWLMSYRRLDPLKKPYVRQDRQRGYLKEMTTSLIDQLASGLTAAKPGPLRTGGDLVRSLEHEARMAILKAINWRYVINSRAVQTMQFRERRIVTGLCDALLINGAALLPEERREVYRQALRKDVAASGSKTSKSGIKDFLRQERAQLDHWDVLPQDDHDKAKKSERARVVCDYVAGMTDSFAERSYERLAGFEAQSVSDFV
jgi:dGTP triphosphohydrolase